MTEADITKKIDAIKTNADLLEVLSLKPPESWIRTHPKIPEYRYLPIDRIEWLLKRIFKMNYRTEVIDYKELFNAVSVVMRIHYKEFDAPFNWNYFDGSAAEEPEKKIVDNLATKDLEDFAVAKAFPSAKSNAIRNACLSFGELFGANLNRNDISTPENNMSDADKLKKINKLFEELEERIPSKDYKNYKRIIDNKETNSYNKALRELEIIKKNK